MIVGSIFERFKIDRSRLDIFRNTPPNREKKEKIENLKIPRTRRTVLL